LEGITSLPIMLQIREAVTLVDALLLKEGMNLHSVGITQQSPPLCNREPVLAVGLKRDRFEGGTGEILGRRQPKRRQVRREDRG
jgi:hypothetical protein